VNDSFAPKAVIGEIAVHYGTGSDGVILGLELYHYLRAEMAP
jgi:hypothetical protein